MLYVGAILVTSGRYSFSKMLQVFSIIIFTVTFSSGLMNYRASSSLPPSLERSVRTFSS